MKNNFSLKYLIMALAIIVTTYSCQKLDDNFIVPEEQAHFTNKASGTYQITGPTVTYKIPIGLTNVSSTDRTVTVTVTSPTGAQQGTHYTLSSSSIVIPAGKVVDSLEVKGVFAQYQSGRKDTLIFTIGDGGVTSSTYNSTFKLVLRGPCFEGDVNIADFLGAYNNTIEVVNTGAPYGPYKTTVKSAVSTGPTTGKIVVSNVYDDGWNDLEFTLDWTDPANRKVTLVAQSTGYDAGKLNSAYAGYTLEARPLAGGVVGTFSACNQTITLKFRLCFSLGCFTNVYTETLSR